MSVFGQKIGERTIMAKSVKCARCKNEIGLFVKIEETEFLQMGGGLAREFHGVCAGCGLEIHWSINDRKLEKLIEQVRQRSNML